ncbi:MAG: DEAD/DEAH box helicase [Candidatus Riflebacteria bacterium]|nr:DEAD/DEAH box helicase [Candidatus Riflebacteria bacterium]
MTRSRIISSMDFLKRDDIRRTLKGVRWDLVIVDEAHYLAESVSGSSVYKTARSRPGEFLASPEVTDNLLLLTATPHSGYVRGFYSLLKLVDPFLTPRDDRLDRKVIDPVLVRRSKREIYEADGVTRRFKDPEIQTIAVDMSPGEEELCSEVHRYTQREFKRAGKDTAVGFAMTILKKRLMSSLAALVASLTTREENLASDLIDVKADRGLIQDYRKGVPLTEEQTRRVEEKLLPASLTPEDAQTSLEEQKRHQERDRTDLRKLIRLAQALDPNQDSKARALVAKLQEIHSSNPAEKLIIFTEYRDTLQFLAGHETPEGHVDGLLDRAGYRGLIVTLMGGMRRQDRRAVEVAFHGPQIRILVATDAASEGLNLQRKCRMLIHYELPWNPNRMVQRNGRIDRWGQLSTQPVQIFNLFRPRAKDDDILNLLLWKIEEIRRDLGSAADVIGDASELDIETLMFTHGGLKRDDPDADKSLRTARTTIQNGILEQRRRMAEWQSESVLASARFGREDHERVERELAVAEADLVSEVQVQAVVQEVLARAQGQLVPVAEDRYRVDVPQSLRRGGYTKNQIPAATFNRTLAAEAETEDLEFLGVSHPLVQSVAIKVRAGLFDPQGLFAKDRISVRIVATAPSVGILFTHLGFIYQKRYRDGREVDLPYAEYIIPTFVSLQGDVSTDEEHDRRLLAAPPTPGSLSAEIVERTFRQALEDLAAPAREETLRRIGVREQEVRQRVAAQTETLRRDALQWKDAREAWLRDQLDRQKDQLFYDDEGEHITWQEAAERRERRLRTEMGRLQLSLNQRISEIDAMGHVRAATELTWIGALLIVPDYEIPYLSGGAH